ncbi:MAG: hypothetical protein LBP20_07045, partial [Treponema sp.]|nr:hypothetical protein [Treponema sp.]
MRQNINDYLHTQSVHDWLLTGISISGEDTLEISVSDPSNKDWGKFVFHNVKSCKFDNFHPGNIILDVVVSTGTNIETVIDESMCYIFDIDSGKLTAAWCDTLKKDIYAQKLLLVNFSTSYGVYGAIICQSIEYKYL